MNRKFFARKTWIMALAILVPLAVFGLYLQPDFMRTMADQIWACF